MTAETLLLVGRATGSDGATGETLATHAERLTDRGVVEEARALTYEREPRRELRGALADCDADRVFVQPMCAAHSHDTTEELPAALTAVDGTVRYCEPVGAAPAMTDALVDRAGEVADPGPDATLVLVGLGSGAGPSHRRTAEYHADRVRERGAFGGVHSCFLVQNPAVECARYAVDTPRAVAVPLFVTPGPATERRVPDKLELDRGGVAYADPPGTHERVTDAVAGAVRRERALAGAAGPAPTSFEDSLSAGTRRLATDGEG